MNSEPTHPRWTGEGAPLTPSAGTLAIWEAERIVREALEAAKTDENTDDN